MKWSTRGILIFIFAIGLGLRLYNLGFQSFWLDEYYAIEVANELKKFYCGFRGLPPVFILFLKGWLSLVPLSEATARLPSALIGALSVPLMYLLGKELFNKRVGLWAAFFLSLSAIHIDFSQEAKQYPLMLAMVLLMQLTYVRFLKYKKNTDLWLYGAFSVVGFYSHYFLFVLFFLQGAHLALNWKENRSAASRIFFVQLAALLCLSVRLFCALCDPSWIKGNLSWMSPPTLPYLWETTVALFSHEFWRWAKVNIFGLTLRLPAFWYVAFFAVIVLLLFRALKQKDAARPFLSFVLLWIFLPTALHFGWSLLTGVGVYHLRYVLLTILGIYFLLAWLVENEKRKALKVLLIGFFVATNIFILGYYYTHPTRTQFRDVAAAINQNGKPGERILIKGYKHEQFLFEYYFRKNGGKNEVYFSEKREKFDPTSYHWVVAVFPTTIDTTRYPFDMKHFWGIKLYRRTPTP